MSRPNKLSEAKNVTVSFNSSLEIEIEGPTSIFGSCLQLNVKTRMTSTNSFFFFFLIDF